MLHKKLEKTIKENDKIKKVITFDSVSGANYQKKYIDFSEIVRSISKNNMLSFILCFGC